MHIESYSFGSMQINGKAYDKDLIIFSDRIKPNWWRKDGHRLSIEDLEEVFNDAAEILIVGTGAYGRLEIPPATIKALADKHIELIAADTAEAVRIFNEWASNDKRLTAAFHLTC